MKPTWTSDCGTVHLYLGDCLEVLPTLEVDDINAVVADPPYGIAFAHGGGGGTLVAVAWCFSLWRWRNG